MSAVFSRRVAAVSSLVLAVLCAAVLWSCRDRVTKPEGELAQAMSAPAISDRAVTSDAATTRGFGLRRLAAPAAGKATTVENAALENAVRTSMPATPSAPQSGRSSSPSLIIRNGYVSIEVDSVARSLESVRGLAASLGGYVGNVEMSTGEHQVHSATMEMKVPAPRFDDAMAGVRPLGTVERSNATAEDVGEEFVDVSARIANGKRLEERLVRLLETRTGKLVDVLAIERELARVREEIERQEGRVRYLSAHIALSTIAVTVHEKAPLVATTPGSNALRMAIIEMWRNMVHVVAFGIEALGVVIPPLAIAGLAWMIWRRSRRRPARGLEPELSA